MDKMYWEVECKDGIKYIVKALSYNEAAEKIIKFRTKEFTDAGESAECGVYWRTVTSVRQLSSRVIE